MQVRIDAFLTAIETAERVRILYAVESGSRAWGFASTDSDWDVRFIYVRSLDWYLSVRKRRDVLEMPIDDGLDASGWDIRKALHLFGKSNPPLLESLRSPLVYREALTTTERLRKLSDDFFSPASCMYHYLRMAERNYRPRKRLPTCVARIPPFWIRCFANVLPKPGTCVICALRLKRMALDSRCRRCSSTGTRNLFGKAAI